MNWKQYCRNFLIQNFLQWAGIKIRSDYNEEHVIRGKKIPSFLQPTGNTHAQQLFK